MSEVVFNGFGVTIVRRSGKLHIQYDAGELSIQFQETEITEEEAAKAQQSERAAYEVLIACQSDGREIVDLPH